MGPLRLCITGAGGYLGRATVAEARAAGHSVDAIVRRSSQAPSSWASDPAIRVIEADLAKPDRALASAVGKADCVLHLAARLAGSEAEIRADTLEPTRVILSLDPNHLVLASSLSVYNAAAIAAHGTLDENCAIETSPELRDAYCRAKMAQETLVMSARTGAWILRIGALYGGGISWNAHLGQRLGPFVIGPSVGEVPLCHIRTAAAALVRASRRRPSGIEVVNVLDSPLPTRKALIDALKGTGKIGYHLPISWRLPDAIAGLTGDLGPGLLRRPVIAARLKPLSYTNNRMLLRLGPFPAVDWQVSVKECA